jgi:hypothetical protein
MSQVNIALGDVSAVPTPEVNQPVKTPQEQNPQSANRKNPIIPKASQFQTAINFVTNTKFESSTENKIELAGVAAFMVRHPRIALAIVSFIFGTTGKILWLIVSLFYHPGLMGSGQVLVNRSANGTIVEDNKTLDLKGAAAIWNPTQKELRISILPVSVTSGDIEKLQKIISQEGEERSSSDFPARSLVEPRPSYAPRKFANMPAVQLDIRFEPDTTEYSTDKVAVYNLITVWPVNKHLTLYNGVMCYFTTCQDPKEGLTIENFEPKEGGTLRLRVHPQPSGESEMNIDLNVDTKINLQQPEGGKSVS